MRIGTPEVRLLLACCLLVTANGLLPKAVRAETRTAARLTPEAVWEAIDAAKDGDTVQLPAGTGRLVQGLEHRPWGQNEGHHHPGRRNGQDRHSRSSRPRGAAACLSSCRASKESRSAITGITFDGTGWHDAGLWGGFMSISGNCKNFRIDHCKFKNAGQMMTIVGDTYGLIDHCNFDDKEYTVRLAQPIWCSGPGAPNYRKPLSLGTAAALYLEDNEVYLGPVGGEGGRLSLDRAQQRRPGGHPPQQDRQFADRDLRGRRSGRDTTAASRPRSTTIRFRRSA